MERPIYRLLGMNYHHKIFPPKHHYLIFPLNNILNFEVVNLWPNFPLNNILNLKYACFVISK